MTRRPCAVVCTLVGLLVAGWLVGAGVDAAGSLPAPEQFTGFKVGDDNKLVRWDKIVQYMRLSAGASDRVRLRELGKTTNGNPFIALEISAPDTLKNLDRYKQLERKLYFQGGVPSARERDEIFRRGKIVVLVTCSIHANEVGATQASMELVHYLATDNSARTRKILDNVIFLLVPSANPDGQILVTDWFNQNLGTPYENSPLPHLYHPYAGHDNNRDMYMFTQKESQYLAELVWRDWFPTVWLDQHQMGSNGPRIFVMPAADPINPNVHPLIYRWNGILGQSQAAALEAENKHGIIYNAIYTNFWEGALAWSGWWHNQIGLLTEVAGVRIAGPVEQQHVDGSVAERASAPNAAALPPPTDTLARTEYLRPWLGGRWTLRDIVDYDMIATLGLLDAAADRREALLRQIYEVNRQTVENGPTGGTAAIIIPGEGQHDAREAAHLVDRLQVGGVEVYRAEGRFDAAGKTYEPGTYVIPMAQVFGRYAKDLLEKQLYPDVRRGNGAPDAPYDVTAWSLGMLLGVEVQFTSAPLPSSVKLSHLNGAPKLPSDIDGRGGIFEFDYAGADTAIAINRLMRRGATVAFDRPSHVVARGVERGVVEEATKDLGLSVSATNDAPPSLPGPGRRPLVLRPPRIALYAPWTGGSIDEGWTRWVLEQYEFDVTTIHNDHVRSGALREKFDVVILADQNPAEILEGFSSPSIRPEFRGGIGDEGMRSLERFVGEGGTLVTLGTASNLAIDQLRLPVRDLKRGLRREQHFAPGTILRIDVDPSQPLGYGTAPHTYGFYNNSPFFMLVDRPATAKATVVASYPKANVLASGWLRGEELMAGRAAVVSIDLPPGRVVLFGLRPQHRAQTHATFPLLFNSLYLAAADNVSARTSQ